MAKNRQDKGGHHRRGHGSDPDRAMRDASPGAGRQQGDGYKASDRAGAGARPAREQEPSRERKDSRNRRGDDDLEDRLADEPERREGMRSRGSGNADNPNLGRERTARQPDSPRESEERDHELH